MRSSFRLLWVWSVVFIAGVPGIVGLGMVGCGGPPSLPPCTTVADCIQGEICDTSGHCVATDAGSQKEKTPEASAEAPLPDQPPNPDQPPAEQPPNPDQPPSVVCGNQVAEGQEACDGSDLRAQTCQTKGFTSGDLRCKDCQFDTSACTSDPKPTCGNGQIDQGEACDGTALNNKTCQTEGFDTGVLACNAQCQFDTSACQKSQTKKGFGGICKTKDDCEAGLICVVAEENDPGYCAATCSQQVLCPSSPPGAKCVLQVGDQMICGWSCDPAAKNCPPGLFCTPLGGGSYCTASPQPVCGNQKVEAGEDCDGSDLGGKDCIAFGFTGGALKCSTSCTHDTSGCTGTPPPTSFGKPCPAAGCGPNEVCVKFTATSSICTAYCNSTTPCPKTPLGAACRFQLQGSNKEICGWATESGGPPQCGDAVVDYGEDCDGSVLLATCKGLGYTGGTLKCSSSCTYDVSGCTGPTTCAQLPPRHCTTVGCDSIVRFSPDLGDGYAVTHGDRFSWLRRDAVTFVKYAASSVSCLFAGTARLGLGDMSMQNGGTPAETNGQLRHPQGTHTQGSDIDLAYYQINQPDNNLRAVCVHVTGGVDQYHCVADPIYLDVRRTALFLSKILESSRVRVIGVDGKVGPKLVAAVEQLEKDGYVTPLIVQRFKGGSITWEATDTGRGWFLFHHHHAHISVR